MKKYISIPQDEGALHPCFKCEFYDPKEYFNCTTKIEELGLEDCKLGYIYVSYENSL